ncbi:MAG: YlmC/YmxH family sporulation protein [Acutalibacteraceae bacterium]
MNCCRVVDLRHKEVINSKNGFRLGCVDDVEINTCDARLIAIIIYGRPKCFGLFGREDDIVIRWENIELIGEDTILVSQCPMPFKRRKFHFPFFN